MNNWDDLRHFLAISRTGSVKAAAQSLGVNQSTVFRRLRSLEEYLGTKIFDHRKHRKYELTTEGESLMTQVSLIEDATINIERSILGQDLQLSGTIRVTTAEDIASVLLPRHLLEFKKAFPEVTIEIITDNRYFSLAQGEADVAIRPVESTTEARVIARKICGIRYGFFASRSYLERSGMPKTVTDLRRHPLIAWTGDITNSGFATNSINLAGQGSSIECNSLLTQYAMTEIGLGIAFLPEFLGMQKDKLVPILPEKRIDSGYLWIMYHDDLRHSARVRAFVDFMLESLANDPDLIVE